MLLDHLSLVASFHDFNRMHAQNLAVCFGPVLLSQSQDPRRPGARSYAHCEDIASAVDFKRHIEVLHYLLQAWPGECDELGLGRGSTVAGVLLRDPGLWLRDPLPWGHGLGLVPLWLLPQDHHS